MLDRRTVAGYELTVDSEWVPSSVVGGLVGKLINAEGADGYISRRGAVELVELDPVTFLSPEE